MGIKAGATVALINAPDLPGLEPLPERVELDRRPGRGPYDVVLLFCPNQINLHRRFEPASLKLTSAGALWVCWPKKASGISTDLTEQDVREYGLAGWRLVDVKVAAIDATWSGLKFVRRLTDSLSSHRLSGEAHRPAPRARPVRDALMGT